MTYSSNESCDGDSSRSHAASSSRSPFGGQTGYAKVLLLGTAYSGVIVFAHWLAYLIRFEFQPPVETQTLFWQTLQWLLPLQLACLFLFGQFRSLLSYFSLPDAQRILLACAATSLIALAVWYATGGAHAPPRSIIALGFMIDTGGLVGVRVLIRKLRERQRGNGKGAKSPRRVVVIGAGDVGSNLVKELVSRPDLGMTPVALFDDDPAKWGKRLHGVPIVGQPETLGETDLRLDEAIFAMPSANGRRVREIVQLLNEARISFETVPSFEQMVNGTVKVSQIRPVEIEDLLGREQVELDTAAIRHFVENKVVMVTGAGGSIGSELCRQIAQLNPRRLLMVEQSEPSLFFIEQELNGLGFSGSALPLVADILDTVRMNALFSTHAPQVIFHAAAHKHVYLMERQPSEAIKNNAVGTRKLAEIAVAHGSEAFVFISTDKAINPTNVMGASKRLAELHLQALHAGLNRSSEQRVASGEHRVISSGYLAASSEHTEVTDRSTRDAESLEARNVALEPPASSAHAPHPQTKLMTVRFGNVLGSSGSVVPIFKGQIEAGGPVTVTHPEVTRYFMMIPEAVGLVLQASVQGKGGEIFVLDMGRPVKIVDLARQMIELSGFKPEEDIEIKFTGLKPGEKLFEELQHHNEQHLPTSHPRIMRFVNGGDPAQASRMAIEEFEPFVDELSSNDLKRSLKTIIPEYEPCLE